MLAPFPAYKDKNPAVVSQTLPPPHKRTLYTIDATFQEAPAQLKGSETITYFNNSGQPLDTIYLRLFPNADPYKWDIGPGGEAGTGKPLDPPGALQVSTVRVGGKAVGWTRPDPTVLKLPLGRTLAPDDSVEFLVDFTTVIPHTSGLGRLSFAGSTVELGYWYPLLAVVDRAGWHLDPILPIGDSVLTEVADFAVTLHVPAGWTALTSGMKAPAHGQALHVSAANLRDFGVFLAKGWESPLDAVVDGVHIFVATPPGFKEPAKLREVTIDALAVFGTLFGKYAYDSLVVIGGVGGVEEPGIAVGNGADRVLVHTIGHQWWYAAVGNDKVRDIWDESLVAYSESLYKEFGHSPITPGFYHGKRGQCLNRTLYWFWQKSPSSYLSIMYDDGALWFSDLRAQMGDEPFFQTLRRFYADHKFGIATWEDWRKALDGKFPALESQIVCGPT